MKILFTAFIFFISVNAMGQLSYYASIQKSNDTLADLRYFKDLDKAVKEKLDSFIVFIKSKKKVYKENKGFIEFSLYKNSAGRLTVDISLNTQYAEYRMYAFKRNNFGDVFAFSFYKSNLVLFTLPYSKHRIKEEFSLLLNELMYTELSKEVQKEIDIKTEEFEIDGIGIVKRYYLE
ncbi:MAG: hypothetical protein ABI685_03615 [Ferruginibacter sp.]